MEEKWKVLFPRHSWENNRVKHLSLPIYYWKAALVLLPSRLGGIIRGTIIPEEIRDGLLHLD